MMPGRHDEPAGRNSRPFALEGNNHGVRAIRLRNRLSLVLLTVLLAGCVTFERAPAPLSCDARLQGRWLPVANSPEEGAKLTRDDYAVVDADCEAVVSMSQTAEKPASTAQVRLASFELGEAHYLALDERDLARLFTGAGTAKPGTRGTGVTLVRYRIDGDVLTLNMIAVETARQMIERRTLAGTTSDQLNYVITGDEAQLRKVLLEHPDLFKQGDAPPMKMRRMPAEPAP